MISRSLIGSSGIPEASLSAILIRGDGTHRDYGVIATDRSMSWWKAMWRKLRGSALIPLSLTFMAFLALYRPDMTLPLFGLVTTAGVNFLATDMASGQASPRISSMNFHDSGTGVTAAAIGDTALQTQAGPTTRATGVQSNPISGTYQSVGTISYTTTLAITEWGAFNQAAQGGTLWDHRVFSAINVVNLDSIQYTYSLVVNAGGS